MPTRSVFNLVVPAALVSIVSPASAQSLLLDLPRDSQHAAVIQRVGITDITINYHRPMVKGRQIWGKLVPYGKSGAPEPTKTPPSPSPTTSPSKVSHSLRASTVST